MKKFAIIAATILLSVALIAPAMAVDVDISGSFRVRGYMQSNGSDLLEKDAGSSSYYDFRLRPELTITVNDNVKINTRVAIVDENFGGEAGLADTDLDGTGDTATSTKGTTAEWDRAWVTLLTDYGKFDIGRMKGGCFGLSMFDSESTKDRFKWTMPVGDFTFLGVVEKNHEVDGTIDGLSDADGDAFYALAIYKKENITAGLLTARVKADYENIDPADTYNLTQTVVVPYWDIKINDTYGVKGEAYFRPSTREYDDSSDDYDISGSGYYIAGTGIFGDTTVEVGYAYASGDDPTTDDENESLAATGAGGGLNAGLGDEWTPFVILQDANALLGNAANSDLGSNGVQLFYAQAEYALCEDMTLTGLIGMASAAETDDGVDDSYGTEIDAKLEWRLTDALTYNFNLGYLMAGDYFKDTSAAFGGVDEIEDTFTIYHKLQIDF